MLMNACGSAENFMSDREVIRMLDNLHRQKMHAESQASLLQEQINGECPCTVVVLGGQESWQIGGLPISACPAMPSAGARSMRGHCTPPLTLC